LPPRRAVVRTGHGTFSTGSRVTRKNNRVSTSVAQPAGNGTMKGMAGSDRLRTALWPAFAPPMGCRTASAARPKRRPETSHAAVWPPIGKGQAKSRQLHRQFPAAVLRRRKRNDRRRRCWPSRMGPYKGGTRSENAQRAISRRCDCGTLPQCRRERRALDKSADRSQLIGELPA